MNDIQIFNSPEFEKIRTVEIDALGYSRKQRRCLLTP